VDNVRTRKRKLEQEEVDKWIKDKERREILCKVQGETVIDKKK